MKSVMIAVLSIGLVVPCVLVIAGIIRVEFVMPGGTRSAPSTYEQSATIVDEPDVERRADESTDPTHTQVRSAIAEEIAQLHAKRIDLEEEIKESDVHRTLLLNRGYEEESAEIAYVDRESTRALKNLEAVKARLLELNSRRQFLNQRTADENAGDYQPNRSRDLEKTWYLWKLKNADSEVGNLLDLNDAGMSSPALQGME